VLSFAKRLIGWQRQHGRHHLPWQVTDSYRIWLSEIMLQQTQVSTVIPYFQRFIERFPDVVSLAEAPQGDVLETWAGLGYYARARNLHHCAQTIVAQFDGKFPNNATTLATLPGIGRSTAAAIAAFAFGERAAILDGNVRRVLCRHFAVEGFSGEAAVQAKLWDIAEAELPPARDIVAYTQGLMDLGSMVCTRSRPKCSDCPLNATCLANEQGQTRTLPTPKPRKIIPQRDVAFLLLRESEEDIQHWLLERRPQQGIWGGLLAPITLAEQHLQAEDVQDKLGQLLPSIGLCFLGCEEGPLLSHTFTHFQLHIQPWMCEVSIFNAELQQLTAVSDVSLPTAALPAPIKKLLLKLNSS
jgi:A/G-specific adenine glycosylase